MKKSLNNKRVARKIGRDEDEDDGASTDSKSQEPVVKRPSLLLKTKKKSSLRLSFGPGEVDSNEDGAVSTPKKSNLIRQAVERNAELSFRAGNEDRPSYTKDTLAELKQSTPSTPKDVTSLQTSEDESLNTSLDMVAKFGPIKARSTTSSAIPTEAEIKEKKERRARLAQEQDFISLEDEPMDQEKRELLLRPKEKFTESRLVREDEDMAEGFDEFVEDGHIALGRKALREEKRRKRREMEDMIAQAEGVGSDEASDDSEVERNEAYEAAQTRAGTYGQRQTDSDIQRLRTPPKITPVPDLSAVLGRLRSGLQEMQDSKAAKLRKLEELRTEKKEIAEREVWIQAQLKEVGERYEKLRVEAGMAGAANGLNGVKTGDKMVVHRGLESFGSTPIAATSEASDDG